METDANRMQQELPRTLPPEHPGDSPPPRGPGPAPIPEKLPGEIPDPGHTPDETPPPIYARRAALAGEDGTSPVAAAETSPASERRLIGASVVDDTLSLTLPIGTSLFDVERAFILATLDRYDGDKRRAASVLGCSVKTLYNKLHLYRRQRGHVAAVG